MSMLDKIIIMLTHNDKTVPNAIEIFEENKNLSHPVLGIQGRWNGT